MNRLACKFFLSAAIVLGLLAGSGGPVRAQAFGSISSGPAVTAPAVAPVPDVTDAPAASATPAESAAPKDAALVPEPVAQFAALGFSSISGSAPDVTTAMPATAGTHQSAGSNAPFEQADRVVVVKHERLLYLYRGDRVIAQYPVKLGLNPYGHKQQEGDFRTPEGKYQLTRRNRQSDFFLSIQVSYPNREDAAWAKENGWSPGGLIMIHGQPNVPKRSPEFYATRDWTDGCIALSNADMVDVWLRTGSGIPIEIRP
jgi:hypothetical protein